MLFLWATIKISLTPLHFLEKQNLGSSKFKTFAGDKSKVAQMKEFGFDSVENTVRKGTNAGNQHFLLFPQCFQKASFSGFLIMLATIIFAYSRFAFKTPLLQGH